MKNFKDFYDIDLRVCYTLYNLHYSRFYKIKFDLIMSGYETLLENKKNLLNLSEHDYFVKASKFAAIGMHRYFYLYSKKNMSLDTPLDDDFYLSDVLPSSFNIEDNLCYNNLLILFRNFCISYDKLNLQIFLDYMKISNFIKLRSKYKKNYDDLKNIVIQFRKDFYNYLCSVGYLDFNKNFKFDKDFRNKKVISKEYRKLLYSRKIAKKEDSLDYSTYKNDFKIYKLIRENNNIDLCCSFLDIDVVQLKKIVFHSSCQKAKLYLYQIAKLKKNVFKDYSLSDLVAC